MWLVGVVSRMWVESTGVASGCGCKEVYRFPHPTPLVSVLFAAASLLFVHFLNVFRSCSGTFVIKFYVLNIFSRSINTHTGDYGRPTVAI